MAISTFETQDLLSHTPKSTGKLAKADSGVLDNAKKRSKLKPPFLRSDKIQLLSRVTEKRFVHGNNLASSYPEAINIYKANSDEFKSASASKRTKKTRKSVHTLPTVPAPVAKLCTVSDMNDSEYYNRDDDFISKPKKKTQARKCRNRRKNYFNDRDSHNILDLDCSSTDMLYRKYGGDGRRGKENDPQGKNTKDFTSSDMWSVLRNINKFSFRPSPQISEGSMRLTPRKKSGFVKKRTNISKNGRFIETCRTAEVSYVANFEFEASPDRAVSSSISGDRITVIDINESKEKIPFRKRNLKVLCAKTIGGAREKGANKSRLNQTSTNFKAAAIREFNKYAPIGKCVPCVADAKVANLNTRTKKDKSDTVISIDSSNYLRTRDTSRVVDPSELLTMLSNDRADDQRNSRPRANILGPKSLKEREIAQHAQEKHKPRLVTTMPSGAEMPKFNCSDIKRKLNHLKFPIVVLGKDQISSTVEVNTSDPPQFDGLDKHIWPFMTEWTETGAATAKGRRELGQVANNLRKISNELSKKPNEIDLRERERNPRERPDKRIGDNCTSPAAISPRKNKNIRHFRDRMMKLLYKKPALPNMVQNETKEADVKKEAVPTMDTACDPINEKQFNDAKIPVPKKPEIISENYLKELSAPKRHEVSPLPKKQHSLLSKPNQQLAKKSRWDFVDNIINKVVNGVYYRHDSKKTKANIETKVIKADSSGSDCKMQTPTKQQRLVRQNDVQQVFSQHNGLVAINGCEHETSLATTYENPGDVRIPGFDDDHGVIDDLEIITLNFNQISVKHRVSNVIVQFDVAILKPCDFALEIKKSSSFIPLTMTESNTKVFKCNTTIVNAILPAELCTMIPKLMRDFIDSEAHLALFPLPTPVTQVQSFSSDLDVSTICTLDSRNNLYHLSNVTSTCVIPAGLRKIISGRFVVKLFRTCMCCSLRKSIINRKNSTRDFQDMFLKLPSPIPMLLCIVDPRDFIMPAAGVEAPRKIPNCQALQLYKQDDSFLNDFCFTKLLNTMKSYYSLNLIFSTPSCSIPFYAHPLKMKCDMVYEDIRGFQKKICSITATHYLTNSISNMITPYVNLVRPLRHVKTEPLVVEPILIDKQITEVYPVKTNKRVICTNSDQRRNSFYPELVSTLKMGKRQPKLLRKNRYVKLYKKCKSTSNIATEKTSTPLSKISNLDDFFQALGFPKTMATVFDGNCGKKLMSSLAEMTNWITEITPRQATLVLLLINGRDSPNLGRFRPVLLQGIAMNRITRASELNMEIEVIETEAPDLKTSNEVRYEGINYVTASSENQDILLEELCWIAKTTASDYHKTFDDSSEMLLRSLLKKRKKLNPSYLRVVARYVGLGLLKTPAKDHNF